MVRRPDLEAAVDAEATLVFGVSKEMMRKRDLGDVAQLVETAVEAKKVAKVVGRVVLMFPEYDHDPREVFEDTACREWFATLEERFPFVPVLLEPTKTLPILMLCQIPWRKQGAKILPSEEEATQFLLNCGMLAFTFAKWVRVDARSFAQQFLATVGLGDSVDSGLLDQYEKLHAQK